VHVKHEGTFGILVFGDQQPNLMATIDGENIQHQSRKVSAGVWMVEIDVEGSGKSETWDVRVAF
jgi:hypothetical protein